MKRFTETEKWRDVWFMDLPIKFKLAWLYMCDQCDAAGIFEPNTRLMECQIGEPINTTELLRQMGGRVEALKSGKWRIVGFIRFQYGRELNPKNNAHLGVIRALQRAGIDDLDSVFSNEEKNEGLGADQPLTSPCLGAQDKEKDKEKDKEEQLLHTTSQEEQAKKRFVKPTVEQVSEYAKQSGKLIDAERFVNHYESNGWRVGRNPMKDWKAAVRTWAAQSNTFAPQRQVSKLKTMTDDEFERARKAQMQALDQLSEESQMLNLT